MQVTCLGAARTVTGSQHLCKHGESSFLVDCGMFQGNRELETRNRKAFAFNPADLEAVLLTHAHVDHSGLLPRLVREGFRGKIYGTPATTDLCRIMLPDSGHIQETEAEWQTRKNLRNGRKPVEPLYTVADAEKTAAFLEEVPYDRPVELRSGVRVRFREAGHILGSAYLEISYPLGGAEKTVVFSGDLGQKGQYIVRDPVPLERADFVFMESTYGNREHRSMEDTLEELAGILRAAEGSGGKIIIPAFAVERTQEVLLALHLLQEEGRAPRLPVYVDSPLATSATRIFRRHPECFDEEMRAVIARGENPLENPMLTFTRSVEESQRLNDLRGPLIIISASGMCTAGRIKHHLKHNLWKPENHVVIVGFQAQGTTGRKLVDGARRVKIFREDVTVRAAVHTLGGFSAHADRKGLEAWIGGMISPPEKVFLVHGEETALLEMAAGLREGRSLDVHVPHMDEVLFLGEPARPAERFVLSKEDRDVQVRVSALAQRMLAVRERVEGKGWESQPVVRQQVLKQMRKLGRDMDTLERMVESA